MACLHDFLHVLGVCVGFWWLTGLNAAAVLLPSHAAAAAV